MARLRPDVVGLVPAAGRARRLGALLERLRSSKEILPVGTWTRDGEVVGKPVAAHLLEGLACAGVGRAILIRRAGKEDLEERLGDGSAFGLQLEYLTIEPTPSVPHTLEAARERLGASRVALGFPDILFEPRDAFASLLERQEATRASLVLGLFPTDRPEQTDMVELDAAGRPRDVVIKQPDRGLLYTWSIAVWTTEMTEYLHDYLSRSRPRSAGGELWVGEVLLAALRDGMAAEAVVFAGGEYLDVGTPEDLERARRRYR